MSRTENITPSGYAPTVLMSIVIVPTPAPKIHIPLRVKGAVTGSVAIKKAHSSIPPLVKWNIGCIYASGSIR